MESHSSSNSVSSRPRQPYHSYLHSIKKTNIKPWKKPVAPLPPTPPKVYKVDPVSFRDLVQRLTGAPDRLHNLAPPPLDLAAPLHLLSSAPKNHAFSTFYQEFAAETNVNQRPNYGGTSDSVVVASSSLELNLSPSSHNWCSFPLLSPGTLSTLDQSTVL